MSNPFPKRSTVQRLAGPWQVQFDPKWGPARPATFSKLIDWTDHDNPLNKYFSGIVDKVQEDLAYLIGIGGDFRQVWLVVADQLDVGYLKRLFLQSSYHLIEYCVKVTEDQPRGSLSGELQ